MGWTQVKPEGWLYLLIGVINPGAVIWYTIGRLHQKDINEKKDKKES